MAIDMNPIGYNKEGDPIYSREQGEYLVVSFMAEAIKAGQTGNRPFLFYWVDYNLVEMVGWVNKHDGELVDQYDHMYVSPVDGIALMKEFDLYWAGASSHGPEDPDQ